MNNHPGPDSGVGKQRMLQDASLISDPNRWPSNLLHLKTQPWVEPRRFGAIGIEDVLTLQWQVIDKDTAKEEKFPSVLDMVKTWSVD